MSILRTLLLVCCVLSLTGGLHAQSTFSIVELTPEKGRITPQSLRNFTIINNGQTVVNASVRVSLLRAGSQDVIANIATRNTGISPGATSGMNELSWLGQVYYGTGSEAASFAQRGTLSFGNYVICISVLDEIGTELIQRCFEKSSVPIQSFSLIYPINRSEIEETRPNLVWQDVLGFSNNGVSYTLTLVELVEGSSPAKTLRTEIPLLYRSYLTKNTLAYPNDAPKLQRGHTYVWDVKAVDGRGEFLASQQWVFTIAEKAPIEKFKQEVSYAMLRSSSSGQPFYFHLNKELHIAFDNNETMQRLDFSLYDLTKQQIIDISQLPAIELRPGLNTVRIPTSPLGLKEKHLYQITVNTPRRQVYSLEFRLTK